ncbi:MAG: dienelactone hydrolase family protein [Chloroflexi bacterium]|nr:dienelactone hydrolase family protein [Chloroflexota bacterium]
MPGEMIEFAANGGSAKGYLARPPAGRGPGVIVVQEWWGLNDQIMGTADRLAAEGFLALVPDLYHGDMAQEPGEAQKLMMALNVEQAAKDLRGAGQALRANGASGEKVAAVGFCMGGQLALYAGTVSPDVGTVVDCYGGHPNVRPDYPRLQGPVLLIAGDKDPMAGPGPLGQVLDAIKAVGQQAELIVYPGAGHAFMNEQRPDAYHEQHAGDAWSKMVNHLKANLR